MAFIRPMLSCEKARLPAVVPYELLARLRAIRIPLTWPLLGLGTVVVLAGGVTTLALATDHSHTPSAVTAATAYQAADDTRSAALAAHGLHPIIWNVPPTYARTQLLTALAIDSRFTEDVARIAFPLPMRCDAHALLEATDQLKVTELKLVQESYTGTFSHDALQGYLQAESAWSSADGKLRQDLGLSLRIPVINWWPSSC
jgi:hypothetical protein